MSVSIDQLEAFVETCQHGSFSAAARHLEKAQSVVSTLVANLEIDLGVELFDRTGRYPIISEAGENLLERAKSIIEQRQRFIVAADEITADIESNLRIVIENQIELNNLGQVLIEFAKEFPNVDVHISYGTIQEAWTSILENESDLGILAQPEVPLENIDFMEVGRLKLAPFAAKTHALGRKRKISWEDLKLNRQILIKGFEDSSMNRSKVAYQTWQVATPNISKDLVQEGLGWAILPINILKDSSTKNSLKKLNLAFDKEDFTLQVDLIWSSKRARGPASKYLSKLLTEQVTIKN